MNKDQSIQVKSVINQTDNEHIKGLQAICEVHEKIALKLELEYKMSLTNDEEHLNEFMYYDQDLLVGYLGICQFNRKVIEINGMVHPKYRKQGIFTQLFSLVLDEWNKRDVKQMLLVCDKNSPSGQGFIKKSKAIYEHTESEMVFNNELINYSDSQELVLREATNSDVIEILKQNEIYFNERFDETNLFNIEDKKKGGQNYYLALVNNQVVGKVHTEIIENKATIYGLGIKPDDRGKGYGRALLINIIKILKSKSINQISLQVEIKNEIANQLYKSCGFKETYALGYYKLNK